MASISSVILKNVVNELQSNVAAEMTRFQQHISALDAIIRHSTVDTVSITTTANNNVSASNTVSANNNVSASNTLPESNKNSVERNEIVDIQNNISYVRDTIDKQTYVLDTMSTAVSSEINKLKDDYKAMNTNVAQSFEVLGNAFNQQVERIMSLEAKYNALESRVAALTVNNVVAKECIEHKTNIIMESPEEIIKDTTTPPNTPSSSECEDSEPDIEDSNIHYESEAEPDIEDVIEEEEETKVEEEKKELVEVKAEVEADVEEEEAEAEEEEAEEEAEEEEAEVEYEEVTYKGNTYYVDPDNIAYTMDDEGSLNEDPVGVWVPEKKIVRFYKK